MSSPPYHGRRTPYTEVGVARLPCTRCGRPASRQWQACANGGRYVPVCALCDYLVNAVVLRLLRLPGADDLLRRYLESMAGDVLDLGAPGVSYGVDDGEVERALDDLLALIRVERTEKPD